MRVLEADMYARLESFVVGTDAIHRGYTAVDERTENISKSLVDYVGLGSLVLRSLYVVGNNGLLLQSPHRGVG